MVAPIVAAKAAEGAISAGKALTGDIYTRRWTSEKGKGKKKRVVEHELKVNAVSAAAIAAGAALTGLSLAGALWFTQRKLTTTEGKDMKRIYDWHNPVYTTTTVRVPHVHTVTDMVPFYREEPIYAIVHGIRTVVGYEKVIDGYTPATREVTTYTTETKTEITTQPYGLVRTQKGGIPVKVIRAKWPAAPNPWDAISAGEKARGWRYASETKETFDWGHRYVITFHNDKKSTLGTVGRDGFKIDMGL